MAWLWLGVGAKAMILVPHLHPKSLISKLYPNHTKMDNAGGLIIVSESPKPIHHEETVVVVFHHPPKDQQREEFDCWAIHCFVHVTEEGEEEWIFSAWTGGGGNNSGEDGRAQQDPNNAEEPPRNEENVPAEIVPLLETTAGAIHGGDEDLVRNILPGMVDDENQPLPENIPTAGEENEGNNMQFFSEWKHSGSCYHCLEGGHKNKARINFNTDVKPTIQQLFEIFFSKPFVIGTIIPQMNKQLQEEKHHPVSYGECLHWISLWFLVAAINGPEHQEFWSLGEIDWFAGAQMRLGTHMSKKRFDTILKALSITSHDPPAFRDHFWEICEILKAWNENMMEQFTPSWVSCLDESMSTWTDKYGCSGWMFVQCKPWPFGNEYHMVCCSLSGILWQMEIVEGKDAPSQIVPKFNNQGKTVGLLLHVLEPIFGKGNMVVLDSGFCVLKGIMELKKHGIYTSTLLKKLKYWPKYIKGKAIKQHFEGKQEGDCNSW